MYIYTYVFVNCIVGKAMIDFVADYLDNIRLKTRYYLIFLWPEHYSIKHNIFYCFYAHMNSRVS